MLKKRIVITGMAINTPIGDTLDGFTDNLLAGKSALCNWKELDVTNYYSKVGGDMSDYDFRAKINTYKGQIPDSVFEKLN